MRRTLYSRLVALCGVCLLLGAPASARAGDNFKLEGVALFTNIQNGLFLGEDVPYFGLGTSKLIGLNTQTGSIRPTLLPPDPNNPTKLMFTGVAGAHPFLPFGPRVHVITTADGVILCTWTADFTIQFVTATDVIFSGDGVFTVIGGTGKYRKATGTFRTLFSTGPIPFTSDSAIATVNQLGTINRK